MDLECVWRYGAQWADIAAGNYDSSVIDPEAARLKTIDAKFFIDFDHEMDGATRTTKGTNADYVAAYRHVRDRLTADGVTNAVYVWTVTGYSGNYSQLATLYPGDSYVDWVAWDPYNHNSAAWKSPEQTFSQFYNWLDAGNLDSTGPQAKAKPRMLSEYGCSADDRREAWMEDIPTALKDLPKLKAIVYWASSANYAFDFTGDAASIAGFKQAGQDPYLNQSSSGTPTPTATPTPTGQVTGDITGDGRVDVSDLSVVLSHWMAAYTPADLNHDNMANILDLSILLSHWTG